MDILWPHHALGPSIDNRLLVALAAVERDQAIMVSAAACEPEHLDLDGGKVGNVAVRFKVGAHRLVGELQFLCSGVKFAAVF